MANTGKTPSSMVAFCTRPWHSLAALLAVLVFATFAWGFYLLDHYKDDGFFSGYDDLSISGFLLRDVAGIPNSQRLLSLVPPAVVGVSDRGVNATVLASGAIVGANGYVLTTLHSVASLPDIDVHVRTTTGVKRYPAQIVKMEPKHDLALLKMRTGDRFLFFVMAGTQAMPVATPVFGFGYGVRGGTVFREGRIVGNNISLTTEASTISHLLASDAVYSWEQNGGPLVNIAGELVGISIAVTSPSGQTQGYAVPAHVIATHFQDVVKFKIAPPPQVPPAAVQQQPPASTMGTLVAAPYAAAVAMPRQQLPPQQQQQPSAQQPASAPWWAMARAQVAREGGNIGMNVAAPAGVSPAAGALPVMPAVPVLAVDADHGFELSIGGYQVGNIVGLALLALISGVVGGMMTMGGGVIQVAGMMIFFGYGMYLIRPVAYLTNVFVYGAAAIRNDRAGLVSWSNVRALAPWGVAGVVIGYFIGNAIDDAIVAIILGLFALLMSLKGLHEIFYDKKEKDILVSANAESAEAGDAAVDELLGEKKARAVTPESADHTRNAILGLPMGLVSGILGISGGVVEVPLQRFFGGVSLKNAIANSSVLVFWASVGGAAVAFTHGIGTGLIDWPSPLSLALIMVPGAYVGGLIGARLMKVLPLIALRWIYTAVMLATSIKLLSVS
ncbi:MAG: TSUP family transporter [Alphaproteobacteria bacterium]|nr:TSUP family transporter [Alphaproteobacteria bacterium]